MIEAVKVFFRNYANFSGRSNRADFWWVMLASFLFGICLGFVFGILRLPEQTVAVLEGVIYLALLVPSLALSVRRLHDINKSGWFLLMALIPLAGPIIVLIYYLTDSVNEGNNYGPRAE